MLQAKKHGRQILSWCPLSPISRSFICLSTRGRSNGVAIQAAGHPRQITGDHRSLPSLIRLSNYNLVVAIIPTALRNEQRRTCEIVTIFHRFNQPLSSYRLKIIGYVETVGLSWLERMELPPELSPFLRLVDRRAHFVPIFLFFSRKDLSGKMIVRVSYFRDFWFSLGDGNARVNRDLCVLH